MIFESLSKLIDFLCVLQYIQIEIKFKNITLKKCWKHWITRFYSIKCDAIVFSRKKENISRVHFFEKIFRKVLDWWQEKNGKLTGIKMVSSRKKESNAIEKRHFWLDHGNMTWNSIINLCSTLKKNRILVCLLRTVLSIQLLLRHAHFG